jgi:hypothetical protein
MHARHLFAATCLLFAAAPASSLAETTDCTVISTLPATLSNPGVYCINQDLVLAGATGTAVTITADSVTLDLNGHALRSKASANTATTGVGLSGHKYFTIIDGTIAGFANAIDVQSPASGTRSLGGVIADLKIQRSVAAGIGVDCDGCVVRNNLVTDTIVPASISGFSALGISVLGTGALVTGNRVFNTHSVPTGGEAFGIYVLASNSVVSQNYVANDRIANPREFGFVASGANDIISNNQVQGLPAGFDFTDSSVKYRDNTQSGCTTGYNGTAIDLGGNN